MENYLAFEKSIFVDSCKRTWAFIKDHVLLEIIGAILPGIGGYIMNPVPEVHGLIVAAGISVGSALATVLLILVCNLATAPYRLWKAEKDKNLKLESQQDNILDVSIDINQKRIDDTGTVTYEIDVLVKNNSTKSARNISVSLENLHKFAKKKDQLNPGETGVFCALKLDVDMTTGEIIYPKPICDKGNSFYADFRVSSETCSVQRHVFYIKTEKDNANLYSPTSHRLI